MMTQEQLPLKIEGIDEQQSKLMNASPEWLKDFRQRAVTEFTQLGLPTVKDEEWKYTSLAELASKRMHLPTQHKLGEDKQLNDYINKADINIILINGVLWAGSPALNLPKGIMIKSFSQACAEHGPEVKDTISKITSNDSKFLLYLNHALFVDGIFIKVDKDAVVEPLVHIIHLTNPAMDDSIVFPRTLIHVGQGAKVSVLESHLGFSSHSYRSNALTDMRIGEGAHVQYSKAEGESVHATHTASTRIWQERSSHLESFSFAHQAKLVRNNLSILIKGEGTNTIMNGFYALEGKQHVDNHTLLDIQQPNCTSYQLYKGILKDASHVVFNGKIYVHPIAQKTNGYQLNKHLLLGKEVKLDTKPQLEIFADDVKCTHGATIGQLSDEEIFYLQSRCISKELASELLAKGFIDDVINMISSQPIREKINKLIAKKFPEVRL